MSAPELPKVCVIGAGSSGITALKALVDRGIPCDCFEKSDAVGGNWVFGNRNGMSSSYSTLHINTSRERMEYADFPMPASYPDFPRHDQIARYFNDYVDHFGLREKITFQTGVEHARQGDDGVWEVAFEGEGVAGGREVRRYDALLVANGHHWNPRWPEPPIPGSFDGQQIHAHEYKEPGQLAGRRVVVVGMGNSAMDIAVDASYHALSTTLVARRGVHVVPKYILGRPLDAGVRPSRMPFTWLLRGMQVITRVTVGPMERYGLPRPDHRLGQAHPTVSSRILDRLAHGAIAVKPEIAELAGTRVRFADGSEQEADLIVYCTGYRISFPFFDEGLVSAPENRLVLYKRVFSAEHPGLYFIGFVQPWGAIMPIAEGQGRLVADHLTGLYALPSMVEMEGDMQRMLRRQSHRYQASKRHTIQVDFSNYMVELADERRAGMARARERGFAPPFAPRAAQHPALASEAGALR
ncbi:MAG TPA: NAD(P)-binding domain-containing protein [Solirubrobacteraceae bacterium]|jgi:dimethylaniline monooxygenase (N-oxide forming)|nr:NAD(P)-binding domain-containing protein [Solirubrobacteraceae bacterium]